MALIKELGSLQEKVLYFLAENPEHNKQSIQQNIGHPAEQYGSVQKATNALEKAKYIESKKGLSKKNVKIKIYTCTMKGLFHVWTKNSNVNILKTFNAYKDKYSMVKILLLQHESLGDTIFRKFFKYAMQSYYIAQKGSLESAIIHSLTMPSLSENFSPEEYDIIKKKGFLKGVPSEKLPLEFKDLIAKIRKRIKEFL